MNKYQNYGSTFCQLSFRDHDENGRFFAPCEEMIEKRQNKGMYKLMKELRKDGVLEGGVRDETKESIRKKMRELDTKEWMKEMNGKTCLNIYKKRRQE